MVTKTKKSLFFFNRKRKINLFYKLNKKEKIEYTKLRAKFLAGILFNKNTYKHLRNKFCGLNTEKKNKKK